MGNSNMFFEDAHGLTITAGEDMEALDIVYVKNGATAADPDGAYKSVAGIKGAIGIVSQDCTKGEEVLVYLFNHSRRLPVKAGTASIPAGSLIASDANADGVVAAGAGTFVVGITDTDGGKVGEWLRIIPLTFVLGA